ncbi:hypothetical protein [Legionella impletisoli]|uniref:Uncharacterized protein n=1 Tax=Legionella impletisoli TaxID=343510 RepID=A0A917NDV1_9GAMM|nr:hypothetical protein [Legionella impletisoli]GGI92429.1 hypothetical protein GCM10007966_21350 [Legionella impletisoli]
MQITLNQPVKTIGPIFLCNTEADIVINAELLAEQGRIYILGRSVTINAPIRSKAEVKICGTEEGETLNIDKLDITGAAVTIGSAHFPSPFMRGEHITDNIHHAIERLESSKNIFSP